MDANPSSAILDAGEKRQVTVKDRSVLLELRDRVGWVILNRPARLNAFDGAMRTEVVGALREALGEPRTRAVVLTGAGRGFCAGADISYLQTLREREDARALGELVDAGRQIATMIRESPKPVIAAVNGPAAGGGANLALACDLRIASAEASIGQTFVKIGLHPDWGGTFFLPRLVGPARALELMWTGRMVKADEALALGLFDRVVAPEALEAEVTRFAEQLAAAAPEAVGRIKAAVYTAAEGMLTEALRVEHANQILLFRTGDAAEGLRAFREKRPPEFGGEREAAGRGEERPRP